MISFLEEQTIMMLIDLRNKGISGKEAENAFVKAEITVNKIWFHLMINHHL
jgi:glycine/serine hydroxymethyltransferase